MAASPEDRRYVEAARELARRALELLAGAPGVPAEAARAAAARLLDGHWMVLVSGLRSTGKSSLVSALWGDSELLPTAVRDCTQTDTLVRAPAPGEADRQVVLRFLERQEALAYAARDLACHRLEEVISEFSGPLGRQVEEMPPGERVRWAAATVRRLFAEHPRVHVLHEPAVEHVEKLEQFLEFVDSPGFLPGGQMEVGWGERREYLMGRRRPDGRTVDVGKLLALRLVEVVRGTGRWGDVPPQLVDSPWIPTFHNARRADLVLRDAAGADAMVIVALPEAFELEAWAQEAFRARPDLAARTVVVFNQVDTVDVPGLFGRGGFAEAWRENLAELERRGIRRDNVLPACAQLPFLEGLPRRESADAFDAARAPRMRDVLARLARRLADRPADEFTARMGAACEPSDCGVESLRRRLVEMSREEIPAARANAALAAIAAVTGAELAGEAARAWPEVSKGAAGMVRGTCR